MSPQVAERYKALEGALLMYDHLQRMISLGYRLEVPQEGTEEQWEFLDKNRRIIQGMMEELRGTKG